MGTATTDAINVSGFTPAQIRTAYGLNNLSADASGKALDGSGQTIALIEAYDDPLIFQDLDDFDAQFGTTFNGPTLADQYGRASSFLTVVNQEGKDSPLPSVDPAGPGENWEGEEMLDVEWALPWPRGRRSLLWSAIARIPRTLMLAPAWRPACREFRWSR